MSAKIAENTNNNEFVYYLHCRNIILKQNDIKYITSNCRFINNNRTSCETIILKNNKKISLYNCQLKG